MIWYCPQCAIDLIRAADYRGAPVDCPRCTNSMMPVGKVLFTLVAEVTALRDQVAALTKEGT